MIVLVQINNNNNRQSPTWLGLRWSEQKSKDKILHIKINVVISFFSSIIWMVSFLLMRLKPRYVHLLLLYDLGHPQGFIFTLHWTIRFKIQNFHFPCNILGTIILQIKCRFWNCINLVSQLEHQIYTQNLFSICAKRILKEIHTDAWQNTKIKYFRSYIHLAIGN